MSIFFQMPHRVPSEPGTCIRPAATSRNFLPIPEIAVFEQTNRIGRSIKAPPRKQTTEFHDVYKQRLQ